MRGRIGPRVIRATVFRQASIERLLDAKHLLEAGRFQGAIYLCGYAIECELKANCAARQIGGLDLVEAKKIGHDLRKALEKAGRGQKLFENKDLWITFNEVVTGWSTEMRYLVTIIDEGKCKRFMRDSEDLISWLRTQSNL